MASPRRLRSQKVPLETALASASAENKKSIHPTPQKTERPLPGTQHDSIKALPRKTRKRPRRQAGLEEDGEHWERDQAHATTAVPLTTSPPYKLKHPDPIGGLEPFKKREWVSNWVESSTGEYEDVSRGASPPQSIYSGEPPTKTNSPSRSTVSGQSATKQADYEWKNLEPASILFKDEGDAEAVYPVHVAKLVMLMGEIRESSNLTKDSIQGDGALWQLMGASKEEDVLDFFKGTVFPARRSAVVLRHSKQPMRPKYVPRDPTLPGPIREFVVSTPVPDMLYGYNHQVAVSAEARKSLYRWGSGFANKNNLLFPFLVVEITADEPMWAARNQCLGGASTCVRIVEQLNENLQKSGAEKAQQVDSTTFSVAINGLVAMLYVTWFDQGKRYLTRLVKGFFLHDFDQFLACNDHVQNIFDWAAGARLDAVRKALAQLSSAPAPEAPEAPEDQDEDESSVSGQAKPQAAKKSIPPGPRPRRAAKRMRARIA